MAIFFRIGKPSAVLLSLLLARSVVGPVYADVPKGAQAEAEVKAVFLFNFIRYLTWPEKNDSADFLISVLGDSPIYGPLREIAGKKSAGSIPIRVQQSDQFQTIGIPRILFISDSVSSLLPEILEKFRGTETLIVGETEGLAVRGAAINFVLRDDSVKFEINVAVLKAARIQAGSQLLRLAILVDGEAEGSWR